MGHARKSSAMGLRNCRLHTKQNTYIHTEIPSYFCFTTIEIIKIDDKCIVRYAFDRILLNHNIPTIYTIEKQWKGEF